MVSDEQSSIHNKIEQNTEQQLQEIEDRLPDRIDVPAESVVYALAGADDSHQRKLIHGAIADTFKEIVGNVNLNPFVGDVEETHDTPDGLMAENIAYKQHQIDYQFIEGDQSSEELLYDSIWHSWEVFPKEDELLIEFHAASTPYIHHSDPILAVLPDEIQEDGRHINTSFQSRAFVLSCLNLMAEIDESEFSNREGIIYHMASRYDSGSIASRLSNSTESSVSSGSVRKSISRIRDKLETAEFMVGTFDVDTVGDVVKLDSVSGSLLSHDEVAEISKYVSGTLTSSGGDSSIRYWDLGENDGVQLSMEINPSLGSITVHFYVSIARLPEPVVVDINQYGDSEKLQDSISQGGASPSGFTSVSEAFAATGDDVLRALVNAFKRVDSYAFGRGQSINPVATEAHTSDDHAGGGFVTFSQHCDIIEL